MEIIQFAKSAVPTFMTVFMNICDTFANDHDKVVNVYKVLFAKYCR